MATPVPKLTALVLETPQLMVGAETLSVNSSVLPLVIAADTNTTRVEVAIYNTSTILTAFTQSNGQNIFQGSIPLVPTVGATPVQIVGRNYNPTATWAAATAFPVGYTFVDPNGNVQSVSTPGTSGLLEPTWSTTVGAITADGSGATQVGWTNLGVLSITPTLTFQLLFFQSNLALAIGPPSGISAEKDTTDCLLQWALPTYPGFIGVRVMLSTDPAGINPPFTQYGDLVNNVTSSINTVIDSQTSTSVDGNTTTITTVQTTSPTNFSSVDVPQSFINSDTFYAMFSTVIQDPGTNALFESQQNGPLLCGYVNLKVVNPTDFPVLQRKEDIASRLISQINRQRPNLDLSPRSEIRDIFVDPFALELANMSVREWFARVATSISAISQVDDANGDGVSDDFNSSTYKQNIARAFGLNADNTQNLIDTQFNLLGEQAGLTRTGSSTSTVMLTFYTYTQPTSNIVIPENATVATIADQNTPALNFITRGSAVLDASNVNSFYNPVQGWWSVSVPAECTTAGSIGNVGAGTIRQTINNLPGGINVTNLTAAAFGTDGETNAHFAARIQLRLITGVDSGTRHGYLGTALATPGIISAMVVAAGDVEMLRDWDAIRQKHVFGTVDIYTQGTTFSEQDETVAFAYQSTGTYGNFNSYLNLTLIDPRIIKLQVASFSQLPYPLYTGVELEISRGTNTFYLGLQRAQFDNVNGNILVNPNDMAYVYVGSGATIAQKPLILNNNPATNLQAIATIAGVATNTYSIGLFARELSPLLHTPALQPVLGVFSVTGQSGETGLVSSSLVQLIHTSDFLLNGGSNKAGDEVQVSAAVSLPVTKTITALTATPVAIDVAMDVPVDLNGNPQNISSVRSLDLSTLYTFGIDYSIVALEPYHTYGLQVLSSSVPLTAVSLSGNVLTVIVNNNFGVGAPLTLSGLTTATFLNGQNVVVATATPTQFTAVFPHADYASATDTGLVTGSAIQNNQSVLVGYNQFVLYERLNFVSGEVQVLNGTTATPLDQAAGFVDNTWLPQSYSRTDLILDGWDGLYNSVDGGLDVVGSTGLVGALVPYAQRYIKVTFNGEVMHENLDFTLSQDANGLWDLTRIITGHIPDGGEVAVSYFYVETFTIATQFPSFVQVLANQIAVTKHAAADVLVKAMIANPVDISMGVTLTANASPEVVDPIIRSIISIALDNASTQLYQSEVIRQVQAITGVQGIELPLLKFAKSDGAYDVGVVIPTATTWIPLANDPAFAHLAVPANSFISAGAVLPDNTIPSGGEPDAVVDFLYQSQQFRRAMSVQDFLQNSPVPPHLASLATPGSFYIFGVNDQINAATPLPNYQKRIMVTVPQDVTNPGVLNFLVTYQVFEAEGAQDITVSSTEFLIPGALVINYSN